MYQIAQLLLIVAVLELTSSDLNVSNRILNGDLIPIEERPYLVSLSIDNYYRCAGSIISSRWILTAAHCLIDKTHFEVRAGTRFSRDHGLVFYSKELIIHPDYDDELTDFDIGLIDLGSNIIPLNNINMEAVELIYSGAKIRNFTEIVVAGWGLIDDNGRESKGLTEMRSWTLDSYTCKQHYNLLTSRMICIVPSYMKTCNGDSGGPMLMTLNDIQIGIVSYGDKVGEASCDFVKFPSVFTNLAHPGIRNWIKAITGI